MPPKSAAAAAASTSGSLETFEAPDPQRPFNVLCRDSQCRAILGHSSDFQGIFPLEDAQVLVLGFKEDGKIIRKQRIKTKKTTADGHKCCEAKIGRIFTIIPAYPHLEGRERVTLFRDSILIDHLDQSSSNAETPASRPSRQTDDQSQDDQTIGGQPEDQEPTDVPSSEEMAEDILGLKRFCLNLDETQEILSKQVAELQTSHQAPQNPNQDLQKELDDLKCTFKTFEHRLTAVESSVQNRLTALESALQIILENQTRNHAQVDRPSNTELSSRKSNISVEIPFKRMHRSSSPKPLTEQQQQNISPPPSEELIDESNEDTTSKSKHTETRTARSTKSQPRQAELTNLPNANGQEAGSGGGGGTRQARDEEGTRAETSIVISDDESDDDDDREYNVEHASKRARLSKKQQKQQQVHGKKKRGRPSIGLLAKQELRIDRPDEGEDDDYQGATGRVTRSKRSS
ncbi:hypothetical protein TWF281_007195 [Arthrobotrys megalospora]